MKATYQLSYDDIIECASLRVTGSSAEQERFQEISLLFRKILNSVTNLPMTKSCASRININTSIYTFQRIISGPHTEGWTRAAWHLQSRLFSQGRSDVFMVKVILRMRCCCCKPPRRERASSANQFTGSIYRAEVKLFPNRPQSPSVLACNLANHRKQVEHERQVIITSFIPGYTIHPHHECGALTKEYLELCRAHGYHMLARLNSGLGKHSLALRK